MYVYKVEDLFAIGPFGTHKNFSAWINTRKLDPTFWSVFTPTPNRRPVIIMFR